MNGLVLVMGWAHVTNDRPSHGNVGANPFDFPPFDLVSKCDLLTYSSHFKIGCRYCLFLTIKEV